MPDRSFSSITILHKILKICEFSIVVGRTMQYYIYENWTHDYLRIHKGDCNLCNDGSGMHINPSMVNGMWVGPFKDLAQAEYVASKLKRTTVSKCTRCL